MLIVGGFALIGHFLRKWSTDQDKTQAAGFQLAFSHFAASCTSKGSNCKLGSNPQQYVLNLMAKAAAHPIASGDSSDKRTADDGAGFDHCSRRREQG